MKKILTLICFIGLIAGCSSNDSDNTAANNYDRTALLTNWADNIIIPSYENYQGKINLLATGATAFTTAPDETKLQDLRAAWLDAYKAYQYVSLFNSGKSENISFKEFTNTFPADPTGIENNIATGNYNLAGISQYAKQGFPGLDYLINGLASNDAAIVRYYVSNTNAAGYKSYLTAVVNRMKTNADLIVADWKGGFRDSYIANNDASPSGSFSKTTNNFIKSFERDIRSAKIGFPGGEFSEAPRPQDVEGYYKKDVSKILLNTAVKAAQDFFNGKHFNSDNTGESLKSYLDYLNAGGDQKLSGVINNQFAAIFTANNVLNDSFIAQIASDNTKMHAAFLALQQNLVYLKLDMILALKISIDYVDSDGD